MWECDTSFGVVKIVMATENCENFPRRLHGKWRKLSEIWRKIDRRLRIGAFAMCFSTWWQRKTRLRCTSKHFRVHQTCDVASFAPLFSLRSRGSTFSLWFLAAFSISLSDFHSRGFPFDRVESDKQGFGEGACGTLKQDTTEHMAFAETETRAWEWKTRSKRTFGGDIFSISPDFSEISPLLGWLAWVRRRPGGRRKSTFCHPTPRAFEFNKWKLAATSRRTSIDAPVPARGSCKTADYVAPSSMCFERNFLNEPTDDKTRNL